MGLLLLALEYQAGGPKIEETRIKSDDVQELDDAARLADKYDVTILYESAMLLRGYEWLPDHTEKVFRIGVTLGHKGLVMASLAASSFIHPARWTTNVMRSIGWPLCNAIVQSAIETGWVNVNDARPWPPVQQLFKQKYYRANLIGPNRLRQ